ncbi:hypothetical protein [Micromonospora aurantiaca (nom. illeg.)]|uniref:hypothetical protein n=1 Tax=Micromonospora aurantiaca (nom. illeg.) TaxID=47850 RepID=UPI00160A4560
MSGLAEAITGDPAKWVGTLPAYQQEIIEIILASGTPLSEVPAAWLAAGYGDNTFPFGTGNGAKIYLEKFQDEIHDFLCSSDRYAAERAEAIKNLGVGQAGFVATITAAIAPHLGAAPSFVAPATAVTLCVIAKMGLNSWCAVQTERRAAKQRQPSSIPLGDDSAE